MKRFFTLLALALSGCAALFGQTMSNNGHQLTGLWEQYQEARKADLPIKEKEILSQIKQEAVAGRLAVDFYDAATEYVNAVQRRDWKQREAALKALAEEVKAFDEPIVTVLWMETYQGASSDYIWAYVKDNLDRFQGRNTPFYRKIGDYLYGHLAPFIQNDKEYVLWRMLQRRSYADIGQDEIYQMLKEEVEGRYPAAPALEYYALNSRYPSYQRDQREKALQDFEARHADKSIGLYARGDLLKLRMDRMTGQNATSGEYEQLYKDCEAFEKDRLDLIGDDAVIVSGYTGIQSLCQRLAAQDLDVKVDRQAITVLFRNLKDAQVVLYDGRTEKQKKVKSWTLANPAGSFFVQDTVKIGLPKLSDGHYLVQVSNGDISDQAIYNQYTLSLAVRNTSAGWQAYVTDHKSGEPLDKVTLKLYKGGKQLASGSVAVKGFTPIPKAIAKKMEAHPELYYSLVAESGQRSSTEVALNAYSYYYSGPDGVRCNVYRDRGAYNPGDTVRFKAVVYQGNPREALSVCANKKLTVSLRDSEYKEIASKELVTNGFGSISGAFVLPRDLRNGNFAIIVRENGSGRIGSADFRVDEFVLPTFDLSFDPREEKLYLEGDRIPVTGRLNSYSGHSLTGARVNLKVMRRGGELVLDQEEPVKADNSFAFEFQARYSGYYEAEAIVTDATGEMRSFHTGFYVGNRIQVSLDVKNGADGSFSLPDAEDGSLYQGLMAYRSMGRYILEGDLLQVRLAVNDAEGKQVPVPVDYVLLNEQEETVREGKADSGTQLELDLGGLPSGLYILKGHAATPDHREGKLLEDTKRCALLLSRPEDQELTPLVKQMFVSGPTEVADGIVRARLGATYGPAWVVATLIGDNKEVLGTQLLTLAKGQPGTVRFNYEESYPDAVRLQLFYFMDGEAASHERLFRRSRTKVYMPLSFNRFTSSAYPHTEYTFTLKTLPGVEALAAAWDKSLDAIAANPWPVVNMRDFSVPSIDVSSACGHVTGEKGAEPVAHVTGRRDLGGALNSYAMVEDGIAMEAMAAPRMASKSATEDSLESEESAETAPVVRTDFASALTFQPHLLSADDGTLEFSFRTSDKLSTYYVAVYAHGKDMKNAKVQEEMVVSLPVKVALVQPQFLYAGDRYEAALTVSSITDKPVSGLLKLSYGDRSQQIPVTVPAGEVVSHRFLVEVPSSGELTLTASFQASDFSDAVEVKVPVYPAAQVLTEFHSAVLLSGRDREALLKDLRGRFVNIDGSMAALREITVLDMVKDAIPGKVEPSGKDVLSLSEAWYVRLLARKLSGDSLPETFARTGSRSDVSGSESPEIIARTGLRSDVSGSESLEMPDEELFKKIMACQNADGGFGWFEGMNSSAIITAVMLERFAKLKARGFEVPKLDRAVKFLDKNHFGTSYPSWRGWVSVSQYVYVRSFYPEVSFDVKPVTKAEKKQFQDFQKWAKGYLTPSKADGRGLQGQILQKARRLLTLQNLGGSDKGVELAKAWGVDLEDPKGALKKSMQADISSLVQYAVEHRDGGWYYPNAVMPWRGLMESEAYAHALLCDLLSSVVENGSAAAYAELEQSRAISNGIRLWLMLQKETQKWEAEPAYIDAITSILDGPAEVLDTRVLALSATYEAPFSAIKAAGNGFTIDRKFYRMGSEEILYDDTTSDVNKIVATLKEIKPGDPVKVGEKILAQYQIWNAENRSFVKVDAGREAALRPVQQLSGHLGYGYIRPSRSGYSWGFVPQGYRNVKASHTEYFFDSYPEEKTTLSEEFFVTQAGAFTAPVLSIESLYAPHYRANSASRGVLLSEAQ